MSEKSLDIFWLMGQMCLGAISWLCFPLLLLSSDFIQYHPFYPHSSRFLIFIPPRSWGRMMVFSFVHLGEKRGKERGKEESERERKKMEGEQSTSVYQLLFSRNPSKSLLLSCWPWLDYMLILNNSPKWEY